MERAWFESIWARTPPRIMVIRMILHNHCWYISIQFTCLFVLFLLNVHTIYMLICSIVASISYFLHAYLYYCWYISIQFTCLFVLFLLWFGIFGLIWWIWFGFDIFGLISIDFACILLILFRFDRCCWDLIDFVWVWLVLLECCRFGLDLIGFIWILLILFGFDWFWKIRANPFLKKSWYNHSIFRRFFLVFMVLSW